MVEQTPGTATEEVLSRDSGEPSADPEGALPEVLGRYRVLSRLGRGSMGSVYEAVDEETGHRVAIKAMRGMSPESMYRFKREFRSLASLQHPNVVSLHQLALEGDRLYFTMELVEGMDFMRYLCGAPSNGTNVYGRCRDFVRLREALLQLVRGVSAIHRAGFLHRDIKPSNVLVTGAGRVVLLDFGLVRDLHLDEAVGVTADGAVLGTPLYMSPEQAAGERVGPTSDWYSVGEMLYQALTGRAPHAGLGLLALLAAKRTEDPPAPSALVPEVPADLDALCMELLRRDPAARPSGEQLLARLGDQAARSVEDSSQRLFLGREAEMRRLHEALRGTTAGRPVIALVEGVSGIGKTALVHRFLDEVRGSDVVTLAGRCSERESIPYKALDSVMDHLSTYLRTLEPSGEVPSLLPRDVQPLVRLFPVLLSVPTIAMAPTRVERDIDPTEMRRRGVEALRELLARLADRRRLIVYIDDLQWSDLDSLVLIDAVLRHRDAPAVLLVVTFRAAGDKPIAAIERFVADLETVEPSLTRFRLQLGPMANEQATALALQLLKGRSRVQQELAREVARESEGNPVFVTELVRHAQSQEGGEPAVVDHTLSLDEVIHRRIDALPLPSRQLLYALAVAGGRLTQGVAARSVSSAANELGSLARLRAEHFVRMGGPGPEDSVEIYHDRIREAALRHVAPQEMPTIHLGIARALAESGKADEVALSHHFRQAGEDAEATLHTIAAAEQAAAALAFDRAAELYAAALALGALSPREVPQVEACLGDALANAGRLYASAAAYRRAADHPEASDALEWRRRAAEHLLASGHSVEGRAVLRQALEAVSLRLPTSMSQAIFSLLHHRLALALRGTRFRLRHPADFAPAELARLDACWTASRGLIYTDGLVGADFHARHLRLALRCGEPVRIARALGAEAHLSMILSPHRRQRRALRLLEQAEELAHKADSPYAQGMVAQFRGHVAMFAGDFAQAVVDLDRAVEIFREVRGTSQEIAFCTAHGAACLQFLGRIQALHTRATAMLRESIERTNPYVEGFARGFLAFTVFLSRDRIEEVEHQLALYERDAPRFYQAHQLNYACCLAACKRYKDQPLEGWRFTEAEYPKLRALPLMRAQYVRSELLNWRGAAALAAGAATSERQVMLRAAHEASQELLGLRMIYARGYGHLVRSGLLGLRGQTEQAAAHLRLAITAFERHGMDAYLASARVRLATLVGGREAEELRDAAHEYFRREGVVRPDRFVVTYAPGFETDS